MPEQRKLEKVDYFLQKLKKVVCIVLYGPAISQLGCREASPYQLSYNNAGINFIQIHPPTGQTPGTIIMYKNPPLGTELGVKSPTPGT